MQRKFLIIRDKSRIAGINPAVLKGIEVLVRRVFGTQVTVGHVFGLVILNQPHIGMDSPVEYRLESQRRTSGSGEFLENIIGSGIGIHIGDIAISRRHKPGSAELLFGDNGRVRHIGRDQLFQIEITLFRLPENGIGQRFLTEQHPVETNPFGTSQRQRFHIIGSLDNGDSQLLDRPVATILERGNDH